MRLPDCFEVYLPFIQKFLLLLQEMSSFSYAFSNRTHYDFSGFGHVDSFLQVFKMAIKRHDLSALHIELEAEFFRKPFYFFKTVFQVLHVFVYNVLIVVIA